MGGVGGDKQKLYTATDMFYAQGFMATNTDYKDFDVDVYLFHRGDDVAFRHFMYQSCDVVNYSVATLHDGDETFSGMTKFVLADSFTFECTGFHPHCPVCMKEEKIETSGSSVSSLDLRNTQTWADKYIHKKP